MGSKVVIQDYSDYSQSNEQRFILDWADRRPGKGRWLDLGAADGLSASNTRALAMRGWSGVAVDAAAWAVDALAELYSDRDDIHVVQAAVVTEATTLARLFYTHDLLSTTEDAQAKTWAEVVSFTPVWVATVTVDELLATFPGPYDFASIDVEGTSIELWHELRKRGVFAPGALVLIEAANGVERWQLQQCAHEGWHRCFVSPNNVGLEYVQPQG